MNRNINLYIDGQLADIDNTSLVQFNYTAEDLTNPTIVKNSYSQSVSLPGTPNNNKIFGHIALLNRKTESGGFNAMLKAPFMITNDMGEIIERGYVKLTGIERKVGNVTYKVTLFGGLGEFYYNLSYSEDGEKKTLASLDYGHDLDFTITADTISNAWASLSSGSPGKWSVINFAPAYNGIPSDALSADKGIIKPSLAGLKTTQTVDGVTYNTVEGWAFVELGKTYNEWQTKDLRSYLQRPVISVKKIIEACCSPSNNGGYSVMLDTKFFNNNNPYYTQAWMSLPILNALEFKQSVGTATLTINPDEFSTMEEGCEIVPSVSLGGTTADLTIKIKPRILTSKANSTVSLNGFIKCRVRAVSMNGDTTYSEYRSFSTSGSDSSAVSTVGGAFRTDAQGVGDWIGQTLTFNLNEVLNISHLYVDFEVNNTDANSIIGFSFISDGSKADYSSFINARSGTRITKDVLLATEGTPAEYLVGYCKLFGLQLLYDKSTNVVQILTRNTLYNGLNINLTDRIDHTSMNITPFVFQNKWYDLNVDYEDGEFAKYYKGVYGRPFGLQRINTGYSFDATSKQLLDVPYKGAVEVKERSKYMLSISRGDLNISAVTLDAGGKYSLYSSNGDSTEIDLPTARSTDTLTYFDNIYKGYDFVTRIQCHGEDDKTAEISNVLLFYRGFVDCPQGFQLSDDNSAMGRLNDGEPCWMLNGGTSINTMPSFGRYFIAGGMIAHSLDMGVPYEIDMPEVSHGDNATIYDKGWAKYLADRYDIDTKVVTCKVDFRGITIGSSLLRNFYYFDGCVWVLNKIKNYNVADDSPLVECEFIKVKDKNNYTTGQLWQ